LVTDWIKYLGKRIKSLGEDNMNFILHWAHHWNNFHRNVQLFLLANFIFQTGMGMFMVVYNLFVQSLGYKETFIGQIISLSSLATVLIVIPAGYLSDRVGRKRIMLIAGTVVGITLLARVLFTDSLPMSLFSFLTGLFNSFVMVSVVPFLSENSKPDERVHLFSLNMALVMLAQMIGNMTGGVCADLFYYLGNTLLTSYRYTLVIAALLTIVGLFPVLFVKENRNLANRKGTPIIGNKKIHTKNQLKTIFLFAGASLPIGLGAGLVVPYLNLYFGNRFGASNSEIGIILSLGQLATVVATLIGPAIVRKMGEVKAVVFLQLTSIPFLLITGYTNIMLVAALAFLLRQALMNAGNPVQQSLMMSYVDDSMKGMANSISQMTFMLGWATMGPIATSFVEKYGSYWGYAILFTITSILYLIGSLYFRIVIGRKHGINTVKATQTVSVHTGR
jgi:MFS family permease